MNRMRRRPCEEAAERQGETLQSISFLVMLAASASFMSPFGYQTNLMVYGPGGAHGLFTHVFDRRVRLNRGDCVLFNWL